MIASSVYVRLGGEDIVVAPCNVEVDGGGVFVPHESERDKKTVTWHRIGTLGEDEQRKLAERRKP